MVQSRAVTAKVAKEVMARAFENGESPAEMVRREGLGQVSDMGQITAMVDQVLVQNGKAATDYQTGKEQALRALVGAVMALSKGRADAEVVTQLIRERLPRPGG
jgi:aspartyl-tRNA(Asn)/glutamyl-tRNA(Gln) amidotransferase subunit B